MQTKQTLIQYWLRAGIDLSGLNVQLLGLDSKNPEYLTADVYMNICKNHWFQPMPIDKAVEVCPSFPSMRIGYCGNYEDSVDFVSPGGKISICRIHGHLYCYLECPEEPEDMAIVDRIVHFTTLLQFAKSQFRTDPYIVRHRDGC